MSNNPLPKRLKEARIYAGLTQKALGIAAGIAPRVASPRINQYETGKHTPDFNMLKKLGLVLKKPPEYFYTEYDTCRDNFGTKNKNHGLLVIIGQKIRENRKKQGFSQESFAHFVGVNRSYMGRIERGEQNISIKNFIKIAIALDIDVGCLIPPINELESY